MTINESKYLQKLPSYDIYIHILFLPLIISIFDIVLFYTYFFEDLIACCLGAGSLPFRTAAPLLLLLLLLLVLLLLPPVTGWSGNLISNLWPLQSWSYCETKPFDKTIQCNQCSQSRQQPIYPIYTFLLYKVTCATAGTLNCILLPKQVQGKCVKLRTCSQRPR